ncbi:unnamed protein product [Prorocentrum cordatum]|uniref:Ion transport domain-containing protein n=1 Tax=Prorocentrum cordatum TaxID=2364126 RepID=A0ABN9PUP1_9DINO|nr:unnamed protein product [Polarella glacialis]
MAAPPGTPRGLPPVDVPPLEARRLSSPRGMFYSGAPPDPAAGVARDLWYELFMRLDDYREQVGNMMSEASEQRRSLAAAAEERHGELLQRVAQVSSEVSGFRPPSRQRTSAASTAPHEERAAAGAEGDGGGAAGSRQAMISPHPIASISPADRPSTRSSCGSLVEAPSAEPPPGACTAEGGTGGEAAVQPAAASSRGQRGVRFARGSTLPLPTAEQAMAWPSSEPSGDLTPGSPGLPPVPLPPPPLGTESLGRTRSSYYDVPMIDPSKQSHTSGRWAKDCVASCYEAWMNIKEPERTGLLASLERRGRTLFGFIIFANACWMTWFVDYQAKNLGDADDWAYEVEKAFLIIYCLELALAIAVHKYYFFCNDDAGWNWLDFLIVSIDAVQAVLASRVSGQFTVGRVLRALKIIRMTTEKCCSSGRLVVDEFFDMVVGSHLHAYLHSIGISVKELREFAEFVGADKKGSISVDSLIHGCTLVRGNARNLDMQRALLDIKRIRLNQDWIVRALSAQWGVGVTSQREPHSQVWNSMTESQTLEDVYWDSEGQ